MGVSPVPNQLTMFTFQEIIHEIEVKQEATRTGSKKEDWKRLHAVASELAGSEASDESWQAIDKVWRLEQVTIQDYRGISNESPLTLGFDPSPGITVLHGLNGAGKSSVSDAIELGLAGAVASSSNGTAGKAALWEPVHLSRGSSSARVEVVLAAGSERLILETTLGAAGAVASHSASLETINGRKAVELGAAWHQALASHQPVFAYAALERRVQLSKDLAKYFEGLLALGGSFTAIQDTIAERGRTSQEALVRWKKAQDEAMRNLERIDGEWLKDTSLSPLPAVPEPSLDEECDTWLSDAGLLESGLKADSLPSGTKKRLQDAATRVQESIVRLEKAEALSEQVLSGILDQLYNEARLREIEDPECPVCAAPDTKWLTKLALTVERNRDMKAFRTEVETDTKHLATVSDELLTATLRISALASIDDPIRKEGTNGKRLLDRFNEVRDSAVATQHIALEATAKLSTWLGAKEAGNLIDEAVARTNAAKQWRIARSRAVEDFVSVWKQEGISAAEATLWTGTSSRLEELRKLLRAKRSVSLEGKAGSRVKDLLADAELELKGISVLSTKASMELVDQNGNPVELGMLSAGQRNAVLLAPLLASIDAGPFGFVVLDDPVHAFDELRVDRLADSLAKIAETRRVVVLTHDDRLKENLAARSMECDTRLVGRSASTGSVQITKSSHFWDQLLSDASKIYQLAVTETGSPKDVTTSVRGLCRIGIDNALRSFVLRNAVLHSRDTVDDLEKLDGEYTTGKRMEVAKHLWGGPEQANPAAKAIEQCRSYLPLWNGAIHGNIPTNDVSKLEIGAARKACKALVTEA